MSAAAGSARRWAAVALLTLAACSTGMRTYADFDRHVRQDRYPCEFLTDLANHLSAFDRSKAERRLVEVGCAADGAGRSQ